MQKQTNTKPATPQAHKRAGLYLSLASALLATACTQPPGTYVQKTNLGLDESLLTDARTRLVSKVRPGVLSGVGVIQPLTITCVEPSPDVAVAVANSFGFGLSVLGQGSGSISAQQVEGLAQIAERTAAIQALLKQGYQACLDYANGAISRTTYSLRTSRLDDLMVTMLLAENAAGAFGRSGASIGTKAIADTAAKLAGFPEALKDLEKAKKDLDAADEKVREKQTALNEAEAVLKAVPSGTNSDKETAKRDGAKAELELAKAQRDALSNRLSVLAETSAKVAGEVTQVGGIGGLTASPSPQIAAVLGEMQQRFLDKDIDQAFFSACLTELGLASNSSDLASKRIDALGEGSLNELRANAKFLNRDALEIVFEYSNVMRDSKLVAYCETRLPGFIDTSLRQRHELKMKKLDNEAKRIEAVARAGSSNAESTTDISHPLAAYNLAAARQKDLNTNKGALVAAPIAATVSPADNAKLTADRNALIPKLDAALASATAALTTAEKTAIDNLEAEHITLMGDAARFGSAEERRSWQSRFDLQQSIARGKEQFLKNLLLELGNKAREAEALTVRIKSAT